jgi:hypothetical protein
VTAPDVASLEQQREHLRARLLAQRALIAQQLGPAPASASAYPRSITMRLITQRPALIAQLVVGLGRLLRAKKK